MTSLRCYLGPLAKFITSHVLTGPKGTNQQCQSLRFYPSVGCSRPASSKQKEAWNPKHMTPSCREEETKAWLPRVANARSPLFSRIPLRLRDASRASRIHSVWSGPAGEANGLHGQPHEKRESLIPEQMRMNPPEIHTGQRPAYEYTCTSRYPN